MGELQRMVGIKTLGCRHFNNADSISAAFLGEIEPSVSGLHKFGLSTVARVQIISGDANANGDFKGVIVNTYARHLNGPSEPFSQNRTTI